MVGGYIRRKVEDYPVGTVEKLDEICSRTDNPRTRALIALLYLSGRRIGEVIGLRKLDFNIFHDRVSFKTFNEKVFRSRPVGRYKIEVNGRYYEEIQPYWLLNSESGKVLSHYVLDYLEQLDSGDFVFKKEKGEGHIGRQMAYISVRRAAPELWLHLLRHWRFTHLARVYRDNPVAMHRRTFHKRFESTLEYIHAEEDREKELKI